MPLLPFREQRFHPDLALVHGFLVSKGLLVALDPFHIVGKKGPVDVPTPGAIGTLRFYRTDIADRRISSVLYLLCPFHAVRWTQHLALGTAILILASIIGELCQSIIAHVVLASLGDGNVGPDVCLFDGFEVLSRSIQAIGRDLLGPQVPTKAGVPEQIQHGMIIHHLPRGNQDRQNDATFAPIDHIVGMIAQMRSSPFEAHWCGIRISGADAKICRALIGATDLSLLSTFLRDPVMASRVLCRQVLVLALRKDDRQRRGPRTEVIFWLVFGKWCLTAACLGLCKLGWFWGKKGGQMLLDGLSRLNGKPRSERIQIGIGIHLSRIKVQLLAPHQLRLPTLFDDGLKEAPKHREAIAQADLTQGRMIRQRLIQIISHVPPHAQPIGHLTQEQAFRADVFEKHHQLELEKDQRINGWSPSRRVILANEIVDEREIQRLLQVPIKMILGNQLLQGNGDQRGKCPLFETHHDFCSSSSPIASPFPFFVNLSLSSFPVRLLFFLFYVYFHSVDPSHRQTHGPFVSSARRFSTGWTVFSTQLYRDGNDHSSPEDDS